MRLLLITLLLSNYAWSQTHLNISDTPSPENLENIFVQKLTTNENSTSFLIWIKSEVKLHKHEFHAETIYVLDGTATMTLNDSILNISVGDFIQIPKNASHSVIVTSEIPLKVLSVQAPEFLGKDRIFIEAEKDEKHGY